MSLKLVSFQAPDYTTFQFFLLIFLKIVFPMIRFLSCKFPSDSPGISSLDVVHQHS